MARSQVDFRVQGSSVLTLSVPSDLKSGDDVDACSVGAKSARDGDRPHLKSCL